MAAATAASGAPAGDVPEDREVPLWRLHLLRAMFLVFAVGGFFTHLPWMLDPDPTRRGMTSGMLAGLWILSFFGLRHPLRMLPIFLFEFVWKLVWVLWFGLPQWLGGRVDPQLGEDIWLIGGGPVVFGLLIPWTHVWRHYLRAPAERWR